MARVWAVLASTWSAIQEVFAWVAKAWEARIPKSRTLYGAPQKQFYVPVCRNEGGGGAARHLTSARRRRKRFKASPEPRMVQVASGLKMPTQVLGLLAVDL